MGQEHRYWYYAIVPGLGVKSAMGWAFGSDEDSGRQSALRDMARTMPTVARETPLSAVHLTHCGACSCRPVDERRY